MLYMIIFVTLIQLRNAYLILPSFAQGRQLLLCDMSKDRLLTRMNCSSDCPYTFWNSCFICTMSTSARVTIQRISVRSSVPAPCQ